MECILCGKEARSYPYEKETRSTVYECEGQHKDFIYSTMAKKFYSNLSQKERQSVLDHLNDLPEDNNGFVHIEAEWLKNILNRG